MVHRAGGADDVFFDHQAPHIVGTIQERQLTDLAALRDPARLNVGNVVEIQPRHGLRLQILERPGCRDVGHLGVVGLERPANEGREASRFVLQFPQPLQMLHPLGERFDVAVHHGGRALAAESVPLAMYVEPIVGEHLAASHRRADAIHEDLASAPG